MILLFLALCSVSLFANQVFFACMEACLANEPSNSACIWTCNSGVRSGSYLAKGTKVPVLKQGYVIDKKVETVASGEQVLVLSHGKLVWTKVLKNAKKTGNFDFIELTFENTKSHQQRIIRIAPEHRLVLLDMTQEPVLVCAKQLRPGDRVLSLDKEAVTIVNVHKIKAKEEYVLNALDGSVLTL